MTRTLFTFTMIASLAAGCANTPQLRDLVDLIPDAHPEQPQPTPAPEPPPADDPEPELEPPTRSHRVTATVTVGQTRIELPGLDGQRGYLVSTGRHEQIQATSRFEDGAITFLYQLHSIGPQNMILRVGNNDHPIDLIP